MGKLIYERAVELMEADLGEEMVALDADAGHCFGFNAVARSVWRHLERPRSFDELRKMLLAEYDVSAEQCAEELQALIDDLVEKGLVRVRAGSGAPGMRTKEA